MKKILAICLAIFFFSGCNIAEQHKQLDEREKLLNDKEQTLLKWEGDLDIREANLTKREKAIDSTQKVFDTISVYNADLLGRWQVKMLATETSCEGSAIGDSKTERWDISYLNNKFVATAMVGKNISRVYSGILKDSVLILTSPAPETDNPIKVNIRLIKPNKLEGERQVTQQNNCKIVYALTLDKLP